MTWTPDGKPLRMVGTHTGITELKCLQESLVESQAQFLKSSCMPPSEWRWRESTVVG